MINLASKNLQYVRFYPEKWAASGTVQNMTMEEVGVYWTLLVIQMVDGFVPSDPKLLIRRLNAESEEEVERLLTPAIKAKFTLDPADPSKMYNAKLCEVTSLTEAAKQTGADGAFKRWNPDPMPESVPDIDFSEHLKRMPRRKVKGKFDRAGWERGEAQLKYVISQDEATRLYAAIDAYAKERRNEDAEYHMSFGNFMREWESHVPVAFELTQAVADSETSPAAVEAGSKPKWRVGDSPPWIIGRYDTEAVKTEKCSVWADREKRERWLEGHKYPKDWADVGFTVRN